MTVLVKHYRYNFLSDAENQVQSLSVLHIKSFLFAIQVFNDNSHMHRQLLVTTPMFLYANILKQEGEPNGSLQTTVT